MTPMPAATPPFISTRVTDARYFFLNLQPSSSAPLVVVCGGYEACQPTYHIRRQAFPWFSLELVVRGRGELQLGRTRHHLQAGCVFSYGARLAHEIVTDADDPLLKYFVDFTGRAARHLLQGAQLAPGRVRRVTAVADVVDLFELLIRNGTSQTTHSSAVCVKLLELLSLKLAEAPVQLDHQRRRAYETYRRCRLELERRFLTLHTLDDLAACCRVDAAYLCRLFRQFDQPSPYQLLIRMKMNHAAALLTRSGRLVKQVAGQVGFDNAYHFSRVFKRVHGVSPQKFLRH